MPRANVIQTNFTSGEVSPLMLGRVDTTRYANGLQSTVNYLIKPQGPLWRRSGFRWIHEAKFSAKKTILQSFEFSDTQAYVLEFGEYYMRVFKNGQIVFQTAFTNAVTATAASSGRILVTVTPIAPGIAGTANNGSGLIRVTTNTAHFLNTGNKVLIAGAAEGAANAAWTITYVSSTTFDLQGSASGGTFGAGGTASSNGLNVGDLVTVSGIVGTTEANGTWRIKSVPAYNTFVLANSLFANAWVSGGTMLRTPVEVTTPYAEADLESLHFAQSADVLYIAHPNYAPRKILRTADDAWQIQTVVFSDGPYLPRNSWAPNVNAVTPANGTLLPDTYLEVSAYTHVATAKAASNFAAGVGDEGDYIEFREGDQWRLATVTSHDAAGPNAVIAILDNILQYLDETSKITSKGYNAGSAVASPGVTGIKGTNRNQKLDPNNTTLLTNAGAGGSIITSSFAGTFGQPDIGKWLRFHHTPGGVEYAATVPEYTWGLINTVPNAKAGAEASVINRINVTAGFAFASNSATGNYIVVDEVRSCTITARRNNADANIFNSNDVGRLIRLGFSGRWTWGKITVVTDAAHVTVTLYEDIPRDPHKATQIANKGRTYDWRLGAWAARGAGGVYGPGFPGVVCFHEQRLCFARTDAEPQSVWMSVSGDFENFQPTEIDSTVLDDNAVTYGIASGRVNAIKWMISGRVLLIGTIGGEWAARAATSVQEPITPSNLSVTPESDYGSLATVRPVRVGTSVLYVNRAGRKVREIEFNSQLESFASQDATIISEHILRNATSAYRAVYQQEPNSLYWVVMTDGTLACLTHQKDQEVYAWGRHTLGDSGVAESAAVVPTTTGLEDALYLVVKRTVNGSTKRYIERMDPDFYPATDTDFDSMFFLDASSRFTATVRSELDGLDYLEGKTVVVMKDGVLSAGPFTVSGGSITIGTSGNNLTIGMSYTSTMQILPPEGGSPFGTSQGKTKRIHEFDVRVHQTRTLYYGLVGGALDARQCDPSASEFYTGDVRISLGQSYDAQNPFVIAQSAAEPSVIVAIMPHVHTHE